MRLASIAFLLGLTLAGPLAGDGVRGYYRFPALSGETLVFTAEGDLWSVGLSGGVARRLTTHLGEESQAAVSPDGATLAFSAQYEGPTEVYTMPLGGGLPTRRTWDGESAHVAGFDLQGRVLYATQHYSTLPDAQLVALDLRTGQREQPPLRQIREASWDPQTGTLYFTRLPHQGSHTKRYQGGTAQQIWTLAKGASEASLLTGDYKGTSRAPMFWNGRLYFASDRDGTLNLWSLGPNGGGLQQHTRHRGLDVLSPSLSKGRIAYQLGADLRVFDTHSGTDREVAVVLASDLDQRRERWVTEPFDYLTSAHLSPAGERVVLTARGQVFVAPARQGRLVEASRHPGARYRQARFASDGKSLVVLSDQTGEVEVWRLPADGVGTPSALTSDGKVLRFEVVPSPDGKRVAYHDKNRELWIQDLSTHKPVRVAASSEDELRDLSWSPDGQWLAYVQTAPTAFLQIWLWSAASGTSTAVTSERVDSWSPAWSPDGKWLYLLSDRNFQSLTRSPWGSRQPEPYFDKATRIYQLALKPGLRSPFQPQDELFEEPAKDEKAADQPDDKKAAAKPKAAPKVEVVLAGLHERVQELPVPAGNLALLAVSEKRLFWLSGETAAKPRQTLVTLQIGNDKPEPQTLVEDVQHYEISADCKKLLVRKEKELHVVDAGADAPAKLDKTRVDLSAWRFPLDPREEWRQMFDEAWRLHRDYFYDTAMHGVDWAAMRAKYRPLVERVTDRAELSDLLAQMVGELSALHTFVRGGDQRKAKDAVEPASLGAVLVRDEARGGARVERIYKSDPDYPTELGPLLQPGVEVRTGDVIEAVNGVALLSVPDPGVLLRNQAGRQVRLRVKPAAGGALREAIVTPISADQLRDLRYDDWEYTRRLEVERLGKGELGYVHLRAMGGDNYNEWAREFYPVFGRKGLIVDVRHNRGGNIDSWILGRLLRRAWMYWQPRVGSPYWNMQGAFRGHLVVLMDEYTASDGEAFAEGFRRLGLGKLIGTRTWGGEIWLTSSNVLVDKGIATAAEFGVYGPEGRWLIEGHGVDPDMVVDNPPRASHEGQDAQLEAAVKHLQERILAEPVDVPRPPRHPNLSHPHQQPGPGEDPGH